MHFRAETLKQTKYAALCSACIASACFVGLLKNDKIAEGDTEAVDGLYMPNLASRYAARTRNWIVGRTKKNSCQVLPASAIHKATKCLPP